MAERDLPTNSVGDTTAPAETETKPTTRPSAPSRDASFDDIIKMASENMEGTKQLEADVRESNKSIEADYKQLLAKPRPEPPTFDKPQKPPKFEGTNALQAFGSIASMVAIFGSLLTRAPLTSALNASAAAMQGIRKGDVEKFDHAMTEWKSNMEYTNKVNDWQMQKFSMAMELYKDDSAMLLQHIRIIGEQTQNQMLIHAARSQDIGTVEKVYNDQRNWGQKLKEYQLDVQKFAESKRRDAIDAQLRSNSLTNQEGLAIEEGLKSGKYASRLDAIKDIHAASAKTGWQVLTDPEHLDTDGQTMIPAKQYRYNANTGEATTLSGEPYSPGGASKLGSGTGAMGARESVYTQRLIGAGNQISKDLTNIVRLPITSDSGMFGGRHQGPSLVDAGREVLVNEMSKEDTQIYNVRIAGLQRQLAAIEAAGLMPSGSLTGQMEAVVWKAGDTNLVKMDKLAQVRQIVDSGLETLSHNPRVSADEKKFVVGIMDNIKSAVPFTHQDVSDLIEAQYSNPELTMKDVIRKNAENKTYKIGDVIEKGNKKYRVTGGDPRDPDVELVQ